MNANERLKIELQKPAINWDKLNQVKKEILLESLSVSLLAETKLKILLTEALINESQIIEDFNNTAHPKFEMLDVITVISAELKIAISNKLVLNCRHWLDSVYSQMFDGHKFGGYYPELIHDLSCELIKFWLVMR